MGNQVTGVLTEGLRLEPSEIGSRIQACPEVFKAIQAEGLLVLSSSLKDYQMNIYS